MINEKLSIKMLSKMIDSGQLEIDFESKRIMVKEYLPNWDLVKEIMTHYGMKYRYDIHCFVPFNEKLFRMLDQSLLKYR